MNNLRKLIRKEVRSVMDGKRFAVKDSYMPDEDIKDRGGDVYGWVSEFYKQGNYFKEEQRDCDKLYRKVDKKLSKLEKRENDLLRKNKQLKNDPNFKKIQKALKNCRDEIEQADNDAGMYEHYGDSLHDMGDEAKKDSRELDKIYEQWSNAEEGSSQEKKLEEKSQHVFEEFYDMLDMNSHFIDSYEHLATNMFDKDPIDAFKDCEKMIPKIQRGFTKLEKKLGLK